VKLAEPAQTAAGTTIGDEMRINQWQCVHVEASVDEVVNSLTDHLRAGQVAIFAVYDHAADARSAGVAVCEETVVEFGSPMVGAALMHDNPDTGYELPLRFLIRADGQNATIRYRDPQWLVDEYLLTESRPTVQRLSVLLRHLVDQITSDLRQRSWNAVEVGL
jgi:uncharacterized protein (DUF302 family)